MKNILIVDDDVSSLNLMAGSLTVSGYQVLKATSGLEAIDLCRRSPPDLAILDIGMPGLSGIDVGAVLRTNLNVPFIFLSSHEEEEIINLAVDSGGLGYIVKPVPAGRLIPAIEVALKRASELMRLEGDRSNLALALDREQDVAMATGIIMVLQGMNQEQGFALLRQHARSNHFKLADLAKLVIRGDEIHGLSPGFARPEIS